MLSDTIFHELKNTLIANLAVKSSIQNSSDRLVVKSQLQHLHSIRLKDVRVRTLYEIALKIALDSEARSPGAGIAFLDAISKKDSFRADSKSKPKNKSEVLDILKSLDISNEALELLLTAIDVATMSTSISIRKSASNKTYVEMNEGYAFTAQRLFAYDPQILKNCYVLCIDGFIESVSELHHLLEFLSEDKSSCLIFCRGMTQDIIHTLKVNYDRKTLRVIPYVVPFDVENANLLVDISVVCGNDIVSSLKGDLIASIDLTKRSHVESCLVSLNTIRIKNKAAKSRVRDHILQLKAKINDRPEVADILSLRLRSLTSSCIDICIPDDINYNRLSSQLDLGIRTITAILSNTYCNQETIDSAVKSFNQTVESCRLL